MTVLADHDALGVGVNLDRAADSRRHHRVFVAVELHRQVLLTDHLPHSRQHAGFWSLVLDERLWASSRTAC